MFDEYSMDLCQDTTGLFISRLRPQQRAAAAAGYAG